MADLLTKLKALNAFIADNEIAAGETENNGSGSCTF